MKTINQLRQEYIDSKMGEQTHLDWFDALFTTIKDDLRSGDIHKAQKLCRHRAIFSTRLSALF
ncbi:hypothetical protein PKHYL_03300 [Psychrobacter sp. KH172YL61]|uniref:hypothetical protein n=1 Tax=Psychrobacter sp. KH172YL61 TaxID=2517899 RepID=UPI0010B768F9|nr:hypothetical protein [Psychrobacter sp. KH172YL61]BBI66139.1 hypothetical protein PKHYL_03300 [Psychrobacter sp. KH172YL61]